jgi:dihydropteroate synthase
MRVMGVLNVTPDSFSDGGLHDAVDAAIAHGLALLDDGADIIDIGGESTRPGAIPVDEATEITRAVPVVEGILAERPGTVISIDTSKAAVADAAAAAGASILNDVTASLEHAAARNGLGWIAMHAGGSGQVLSHDPGSRDVIGEVADFLAYAVERGRAAGVRDIWIDPGFGFGKTFDQNLDLLANLDDFVAIAPTVVAVSRKRSLGVLHARSDGLDEPTSVDDRLEAALAIATWGGLLGADLVRVHDVRATVHAVGVIAR